MTSVRSLGPSSSKCRLRCSAFRAMRLHAKGESETAADVTIDINAKPNRIVFMSTRYGLKWTRSQVNFRDLASHRWNRDRLPGHHGSRVVFLQQVVDLRDLLFDEAVDVRH